MSDERETIQRNPESVAAWKCECAFLHEQVEKLTKERDELHRAFNQPVPRSEWEKMQEQLAALAEQNEKFRETLSRWRYQNLSYNWCCGNCGAVDGDEHKEGCALSLPDLASPVLNRIRSEGMRMAAEILIDPMDRAAAQKICAKADELEKTNG